MLLPHRASLDAAFLAEILTVSRILPGVLAMLLTATVTIASVPAAPAGGPGPGRLVELKLEDGRTVMAYLPVPWDPQPPILRQGALDVEVNGRTHRLSPGTGAEGECHAVRDAGSDLRGECTALVEGARVTTAVLRDFGCELVSHGASCVIVPGAAEETRPDR